MKRKIKGEYHKLKNKTKNLIAKVWETLKKPEMAILPGQLAFFIILSIVPIITVIGYGASFFNISMESIIEVLRDNFADSVVNIIVPYISGESLDFKYLVMLIVMFYFASNGANTIILTCNEIYNIKQSGFIKRRLKAFVLTFLIVILYLFILLVPAFGQRIIDAIDYFEIKTFVTTLFYLLKGPMSWIIIFVFIKLIFTIAPDKSIPSSRINLGAVFTTVGLIVTTKVYSFYISNFAEYDLFYAGLSNIMVLMLWIYFLSYIFVIGLSLTTEVKYELPNKNN